MRCGRLHETIFIPELNLENPAFIISIIILRLVTSLSQYCIMSCLIPAGEGSTNQHLRPSIQRRHFQPKFKRNAKGKRTPVWAGAKAAALPAKRAKRASFILTVLLIGSRGIWLNATFRAIAIAGARLREAAVRRVAPVYEIFHSKIIFGIKMLRRPTCYA